MDTGIRTSPTRRAGKHVVGEVVTLELHRITTRSNIRVKWDDEKQRKLVDSIRKKKQHTSALSFWDETLKIYIVADGHRRLAACRELDIPFKTELMDHEPTTEELREYQLSTFIHRDDVNQLDKARAYAEVMESNELRTNKELAEHLDESETVICRLMQILELPEAAQQAIADGASVEGTLKKYAKKSRKKSRGKKEIFKLSSGRAVQFLARKEITDDMLVEMLTELTSKVHALVKPPELEQGVRLAETG